MNFKVWLEEETEGQEGIGEIQPANDLTNAEEKIAKETKPEKSCSKCCFYFPAYFGLKKSRRKKRLGVK